MSALRMPSLARRARRAALAALALDRGACRRSALTRTWDRASSQFLSHLVRAGTGEDLAPAFAA